jgi:lipopolysaccharide export system protein LptA
MAPQKVKGMRNRQAALYARWSAGVAVALCLAVFGVYLHRRTQSTAQEKKLQPVPAAVQEQSAGFAISRAIGTRTLFTVHASQATQFKDENRSLLENVQITIYGPRGDRDDSVHANECTYEPDRGSIRCQGVVQIDLRAARTSAQSVNAKTSRQKTAKQNDSTQKSELHLETRNILFDRDSGKVSTDNSVALKFSGGQGTGTGLVYDPQTEDAKLENNVQLEISPPQKTNAVPVYVNSSAMEFNRGKSVLLFSGRVRVRQDTHTLMAGALQLQLNAAMQPQRAVATENPQIVASGPRGKMLFAADQIAADLTPNGAIQKIDADGNVAGESNGRDGENHLSVQHAEMLMNVSAAGSEPREILAHGSVEVETHHDKVRGDLTTESLRVELAPSESGAGERVVSAETLAPGEVTMNEPTESGRLQGGRLFATFGAQSQLNELRGSAGVRVERRLGADPPQVSTAQNMLAKFGSDGDWQTIDESGDVKLRQGEKSGRADTAQLSRITNVVTLEGSASIEDSTSHLQAARIRMNQATNETRAKGNVVASFSQQKNDSAANTAIGGAQISADEMQGTSPGKSSQANASDPGSHAIFSGHARLWQGPDVLQAQTIEFWRQEKRTEARGNALGAFVEAPHDTVPSGAASTGSTANNQQGAKTKAPVLWHVRAPKVDYWSDSGKMEWSDGVVTESSEGTIASRTQDMFFSADQNNQQTLERAIASGNVHIEQSGRIGTAQRGEYLARDGKFILSGGKPKLVDTSGNTTTGHELTFFLANDSVLVDSQSESRSMTKH